MIIFCCNYSWLNYVDFFSPNLSLQMSKYQQFLKTKYQSLELISIDEQLDCSSSKYITLTLSKVDCRGRTSSTENRRGDSVTLSEALDVEGEQKKQSCSREILEWVKVHLLLTSANVGQRVACCKVMMQ